MKPRRSDGLAEGADMQHPAIPIYGGKCRRSPPLQLQFAQIVILDDIGVLALRPDEQSPAPIKRHGRAQGGLLARALRPQAPHAARSLSLAGCRGLHRLASKHVDNLEKLLRVRLIHRNTRGLRLTEVGEAYWDQCNRSSPRLRRPSTS
ncbi:MAG: helix-turn-helix domain-containing protein [Gammaproteobacteria bacterium]